jgi:hypothetical protein
MEFVCERVNKINTVFVKDCNKYIISGCVKWLNCQMVKFSSYFSKTNIDK